MHLVNFASVVKNPLGDSRFASVDMSGNANVANLVARNHNTGSYAACIFCEPKLIINLFQAQFNRFSIYFVT
jgi:hypothetical protein